MPSPASWPWTDRARLLDVGCGPGTVALLLAGRFQAVVGLDPDAEMLDRAALRGGPAGRRERFLGLPAGRGAAGGRPFPGRDLRRVFPLDGPAPSRVGGRENARSGRSGGSGRCAPVTRQTASRRRPGEDRCRSRLRRDAALDQLRRDYLGPDRRAGLGVRNTSPSGEDLVFQQAGFLPAEVAIVPDQRAVERTADDIVALVFSVSSTAPGLFGDRLDDFEQDVRRVLAQASPAGRFSVRLPDNRLRIWAAASLIRSSGPVEAFVGFVLGQSGDRLSGGVLEFGVDGPRPDACGPAAL